MTSTMTSTDRGYTALLSHLHSSQSPLPLATIQAALAHHLAHLSPIPTPLAAAAVSSPFYLSSPVTNLKLQSITTAFRHASHLKYRLLADADKSRSRVGAIFGRSVQATMALWTRDVLAGVQGGHPVLRLACCSGLLLGVQDLKVGANSEKAEGVDVGRVRSAVENDVVLALAEIMDRYTFDLRAESAPAVIEWEREFQPAVQTDFVPLALIIASQSLPLLSEEKLKALPLHILARLLTSAISSAFNSGTFLSALSSSITSSESYKIHIPSSSATSQTLQSMNNSPLMASIASLSKLTSIIHTLLLDSDSSARSESGMKAILETMKKLRDMARNIETDWSALSLASVTEADIAPDSRDMTKSIWNTLKTFLFSNIMLADAVLSEVVFVPPILPSPSCPITPSTLALETLHTLSHLSFVISQFGGVTSTTEGFKELKKTFYIALDILARGDGPNGDEGAKAEVYVKESCNLLQDGTRDIGVTRAKQAFVLAAIEQLVPVLSEKCIEQFVWSVCSPHLSEPSHRETFESAHSVILSTFASHAQKAQPSMFKKNSTDSISPDHPEEKEREKFVVRMVPFYAHCLIENSVDDGLSTPQLCLAYSALVKSASASAFSVVGHTDETYALAWYCVELLLDAIKGRSGKQPTEKAKGKMKAITDNDDDKGEHEGEHVHRLTLALVSTVPSLPLPLMLLVLDEIRGLLEETPRTGNLDGRVGERRKEVVEMLFKEIIENVGDREKQTAMEWWYKTRPDLNGVKGKGKGKRSKNEGKAAVGGGGLARL